MTAEAEKSTDKSSANWKLSSHPKTTCPGMLMENTINLYSQRPGTLMLPFDDCGPEVRLWRFDAKYFLLHQVLYWMDHFPSS